MADANPNPLSPSLSFSSPPPSRRKAMSGGDIDCLSFSGRRLSFSSSSFFHSCVEQQGEATSFADAQLRIEVFSR